VLDLAQVTKALAARAEHYDRTASFPADIIAAAHDARLLTATVHECYGGQGAGLAQTAAILRALGQGDPSAALIAAMTMFTHALQGFDPTWPDDVYTAAVAESAQRPVLINALRVEPELGTPARGGLPATVASPDGDRWSLTGHKIFSTGDLAGAREAAAAFYDQIPSYQRMTVLAGASRTADLVTLGDEEAIAATVRRYFGAGATEVIFTQTNLLGGEARLRTWRLLGEPASR
jgi:hypothetical protein